MRFGTGLLLAVAALLALAPPFAVCKGKGGSDPNPTDKPLATLLPEDGAVPGWERVESPVFYGPHNLWDCINGAAVLYLDYGFKSLATAYYRTSDEVSTAALEIYQMESPLHAFAIYAAERSPQDNFIRMGVEGYLADNALNFWKGPYYAKVTSYRTDGGAKGLLTRLATIVAERIPGRYSQPEAFQHFPEENRVAKSERYIPKNFLGHPFFEGGYRVDYQGKVGCFRLFLVPNASSEEAEKSFTKYREHLESEGATVTPDRKAGIQTVSTNDGKTVFLYESFIGGVLGMTDQATERRLVDALMTRLKTMNRKAK
jgi:hypothetical protein